MSQDSEEQEVQTFEAKFKMLGQAQLDKLCDQVKCDVVDDNAFLDEILLGWRKVKDENGNDAPHDPAHRKVLLNLPNMRQTIIVAYFESMKGAVRNYLLKPRTTG